MKSEEYVYLGKIVNTHGIKGEIRLLSDFEYRDIVFQPGFNLYIGEEKQKEKIKSYRHHKQFEMIILEGYQNINEVLPFVTKKVYIKKEDLHLGENAYLLEELIGYQILDNQIVVGKIIDIVYNKANILLQAKNEQGKKFYIPKNDFYIKQINVERKQIIGQNIEGLIL